MKKLFLLLLLAVPLWSAPTYTTRMGIIKPADGDTGWGTSWRAAMDVVDSSACIQGSTAGTNTEIAVSTITLRASSGLGVNRIYGPNNSIYLGPGTGNQTGQYQACMGVSACAGSLGNANVGIGFFSGAGSGGTDNIAIGQQALGESSTYANYNIAIGQNAMSDTASPTGDNIAIGRDALTMITSYGESTAIGTRALYSNTGGFENHAIGVDALINTTTGFRNVAVGSQSGYFNVSGVGNTFIGDNAGNGNFFNPGERARQEANGNTFIGAGTGVSSTATIISNATAIGNHSYVGCNNCVAIGYLDDSGINSNLTMVGINFSTPTYNLQVHGSSGTYSDYGITVGSFTAAAIRATVPKREGRYLYCSDCATVSTCVSTGTLVNQWALITNKGASCL